MKKATLIILAVALIAATACAQTTTDPVTQNIETMTQQFSLGAIGFQNAATYARALQDFRICSLQKAMGITVVPDCSQPSITDASGNVQPIDDTSVSFEFATGAQQTAAAFAQLGALLGQLNTTLLTTTTSAAQLTQDEANITTLQTTVQQDEAALTAAQQQVVTLQQQIIVLQTQTTALQTQTATLQAQNTAYRQVLLYLCSRKGTNCPAIP